MKKIFALLMIGALSAAVAGCEASGRVGDDDDVDRSYKKTTRVDRDYDGDSTRTETKTEVRRDRD